jgi:hypothetical protein
MTFLHAQDVVVVGQNIQHRSAEGSTLKGSFTVLAKEKGNIEIRNNKGNSRTIKEADWDEVLTNLIELRTKSGAVTRETMKTRNSTYVLSLIGLWEDRGHKFHS